MLHQSHWLFLHHLQVSTGRKAKLICLQARQYPVGFATFSATTTSRPRGVHYYGRGLLQVIKGRLPWSIYLQIPISVLWRDLLANQKKSLYCLRLGGPRPRPATPLRSTSVCFLNYIGCLCGEFRLVELLVYFTQPLGVPPLQQSRVCRYATWSFSRSSSQVFSRTSSYLLATATNSNPGQLGNSRIPGCSSSLPSWS